MPFRPVRVPCCARVPFCARAVLCLRPRMRKMCCARVKAPANAYVPFAEFRAPIREFRARPNVARNLRPLRIISDLLPLAVDARLGSALLLRAGMRRCNSSEDGEHASHHRRSKCVMHRRVNVGAKAVRENRRASHRRSQTVTTSKHRNGSRSPKQY